ncbi:MAG: C40 family peptidase [Saprospiraceae bacterium]|nr:C40 family peptidase [Saprospiraceae bacterium]
MILNRLLLFILCASIGFACSLPIQSANKPKPGATKTKSTTKTKSSNTTPTKTYREAVATPFRKKVVDYGKKFVGTNYKYAGQSPKTGFDCSGFTSYVLKEFGVMASPASAIQATEGRYVAIDRVMPGDLIFFGESKKRISHVALVVDRGPEGITCVHSTTSRGVIIENISQSSYWKTKILFARDIISED